MAMRRISDLRSEYYDCGLWGPRTVSEVVDEHAITTPEAVAISDGLREFTYSELVTSSKAFATVLHEAGVRPRDFIVTQLPNCIEFPICHLAANRLGAVSIPLGPSWREHEIGAILRDLPVKAVIVPDGDKATDFVWMYRDLLGQRSSVFTVTPETGRGGSFWEKLERVEPEKIDNNLLEQLRPDPDSFTFLNVSSGTSTIPKLSMWTDNNVISKTFIQFGERTRLSSRDVSLAIAPIGLASTGYQYGVLAQLLAGARVNLLPHWNPSAANQMLESTHATMTTVIPTQLIKMLSDDSVGERNFALRCISYAGSTLPPAIAKCAEEIYGAPVQAIYGATDGGVATMTSVDDPPAKRHMTVGKPLQGEEVRLVDATGRDVPAGSVGEIVWRGCNKSLGYLGDDDATNRAFRQDGWFYSGDLGRLDSDGYLTVVGRNKDMIIRGGQNISPTEIENLLIQHSSIEEVAVIGIPDPVLGEIVCACVVAQPDSSPTLHDLGEFLLARNVAKWKLPQQLIVLDKLPKSAASGKLDKRRLRALAKAVLSTSE